VTTTQRGASERLLCKIDEVTRRCAKYLLLSLRGAFLCVQ
jgi:hypothetical protein